MRSYVYGLCLGLLLVALPKGMAAAEQIPGPTDKQLASLPKKHATRADPKTPAQDQDLADGVDIAAAELEEFDPTVPPPEGAIVPEPEPA